MSVLKIIRKPDDFHCHLRDGNMLECVIGFTARQFKRAVVMPNLKPPILTARDAAKYRAAIIGYRPNGFEPLMTIQITDCTTPAMVHEAADSGVVAGKVYPFGVTTNSQNGVSDFSRLRPIWQEMENLGMLVLFHGEDPSPEAVCLHREKLFLPTLFGIASGFPGLKIVLEHITTRDAVEFVARLPENVAATITAHHLLLTIDDVIGELIQPHNFCKPIAKLPDDRKALLEAATSGNPKFFFGSDSAPHFIENKECGQGCAGVFSAPVALPLLAQIFEQQGMLEKLEDFVSVFGARFYGLPRNTETIKLAREDWQAAHVCNGVVVPFLAGKILHWRVAD